MFWKVLKIAPSILLILCCDDEGWHIFIQQNFDTKITLALNLRQSKGNTSSKRVDLHKRKNKFEFGIMDNATDGVWS